MRTLLLLATLAGAAPATAQNCFYFPDNVASAGTCNVIPFGDSLSAPTWANAKYQAFLTQAQLGSIPFPIVELGFAPCGSGVRQFTSLKIQISHTTATSMVNTFAANLPTPVTVLDTTDYQWPNTANVWNRIGLQTLFVYNGIDNLVIDIETQGCFMPIGVTGMHRGTLPRHYAVGWVGTPPPNGSLGAAAAKIELCADLADLALFGTGCAGSNSQVPALSFTGTGQVNTLVQFNLANALPTTVAVLLLGFNNRSFRGVLPLPFDLGLIGAPTCRLLVDAAIIDSIVTDGNGAGTYYLYLPNDTALLGGRIYGQYLPLDLPANQLGFTASNYGRILVGN